MNKKLYTVWKRLLALALAVMTMASLSTSALAAGQVLPDGCYILYSMSKTTGMNVQYKAGDGGKVTVDGIDGETNEIWVMKNVSFGPYVTMSPYHAQDCYLSGENGFDGDLVVRKGFPGENIFQWKPIHKGDGRYAFQNRETGYVIDCAYGHNTEIGNRYLTYEGSNFEAAQFLYPVRISELTNALTPSNRVTNFAGGMYSMRLHGNKNQAVNVQFAKGVNANIVCDPFNAELNEIVQITARGNGLYSIHFAHKPNLCLAPSNIFVDSGVTLKTYDGSRSCLWEIYKNNGAYSFRNAATCLMLDDYCYQTATGTKMIAYSFTGTGSGPQLFYLEKASGTSSAASVSTAKPSSSGLVSPVPAGCFFNKKTEDWDGRKIYHDINVNVNSNTPVYAMTSGTVEYRQYYKWKNGQKHLTSYGNCAIFTSDDGQWRVIYAHLSRFEDGDIVYQIPSNRTWQSGGSVKPTLLLKREHVNAGEVLGRIGKTGNASGYHLHIEVYRNGTRVDPTTVVPGLTR